MIGLACVVGLAAVFGFPCVVGLACVFGLPCVIGLACADGFLRLVSLVRLVKGFNSIQNFIALPVPMLIRFSVVGNLSLD